MSLPASSVARPSRHEGRPLAEASRGETVSAVWRLAWPAIAQQLSMTLVFMADRILLGHAGADALASLQISTTIAWTLVSLMSAVAVGTTALVSRLVGEGDRRGAAVATRVALGLAAAVGSAVAAVVLIADGALLRLCFPTVASEVVVLAEQYLQIALIALPIAAVETVAAAALQASGDTRRPLVAAIVANAINLAVSAVLIFGLGPLPRLGVTGAAIGSACAFALQAAIMSWALWRKDGPYPMQAAADASLIEHRAMAWRLVRVSAPATGEKLFYHAGYLAYAAIIAVLGTTAMAANQALISIEALSYQTAEGFGVAAGVLVGQRLGEGRAEAASRSAGVASALGVVVLCGFSFVFILAPGPLLALFSNDAMVIEHGSGPLLVAALSQPLMAFAVVTAMALRAAGATKTLMWTSAGCAVALRLAATWLFAVTLDLGLLGVWLGSSVDWLVHAAVLAVVLAQGRWRTIPV